MTRISRSSPPQAILDAEAALQAFIAKFDRTNPLLKNDVPGIAMLLPNEALKLTKRAEAPCLSLIHI